MSKVDELRNIVFYELLNGAFDSLEEAQRWSTEALNSLIDSIRQEERAKIDTLLREYELHDHTACHGGEPTWLVSRRDEELVGVHTLYSSPLDALLSKRKN